MENPPPRTAVYASILVLVKVLSYLCAVRTRRLEKPIKDTVSEREGRNFAVAERSKLEGSPHDAIKHQDCTDQEPGMQGRV
jgi:hypothetical protein